MAALPGAGELMIDRTPLGPSEGMISQTVAFSLLLPKARGLPRLGSRETELLPQQVEPQENKKGELDVIRHRLQALSYPLPSRLQTTPETPGRPGRTPR